VLQFSKYRYHGWQQGLSGVYFNGTIKLPHLKNPLFGAKFVALSLVLAEF